MGVPYYITANGGYVPAASVRPYGYMAPYPYPTASGRYSWDYNGNYFGWYGYGYYAYPPRPVVSYGNPYLVAPSLPMQGYRR